MNDLKQAIWCVCTTEEQQDPYDLYYFATLSMAKRFAEEEIIREDHEWEDEDPDHPFTWIKTMDSNVSVSYRNNKHSWWRIIELTLNR